MNERIKQLALQASITFTDYGSGEFLTEDDISLPRLEKFAELLFNDIAMFSMVITDDHYDVDSLYRHYGVEL